MNNVVPMKLFCKGIAYFTNHWTKGNVQLCIIANVTKIQQRNAEGMLGFDSRTKVNCQADFETSTLREWSDRNLRRNVIFLFSTEAQLRAGQVVLNDINRPEVLE